MKRIALVVAVIALMPLLMGAGGGSPGIPFGTKIVGPTFTASVVMDPHEAAERDHDPQAGVHQDL